MKKFFAGLGVVALVALGTTGAATAQSAQPVQPVAEIVAESDAVIASPDATLTQAKPVVTTTAAKRVAVPVAPVVVPVAPVASEPVAVPVVVPVAPVATPKAAKPVAPVVPAERCEEDQPCWNCKTMGNRVCGPVVAPKPVQPVAVAPLPAKHVTPQPKPQICSDLKPGDAWAGVSLVCGIKPPYRKGIDGGGPIIIPPHAEPDPRTLTAPKPVGNCRK